MNNSAQSRDDHRGFKLSIGPAPRPSNDLNFTSPHKVSNQRVACHQNNTIALNFSGIVQFRVPIPFLFLFSASSGDRSMVHLVFAFCKCYPFVRDIMITIHALGFCAKFPGIWESLFIFYFIEYILYYVTKFCLYIMACVMCGHEVTIFELIHSRTS